MIITESDLAGIRARHADQKIVLTSGTFDLFHIGHLRYLEEVKKYGDIMVVMVSGDARVRFRKGLERPIIPENERAAIIDALRIVDYVLIDPGYNEPGRIDPRYAHILADLSPEAYTTDGPDHRFFNLKNHHTRIVTTPRIHGGTYDSTSAIIRHIARLTHDTHQLIDD